MKKGFSATEFLKRSLELEEQQTEEKLKPTPIPKANAESSAEAKQDPIQEALPQKVDDLRIDKSFYKVPNAVDDIIAPTLTAAEEVVYRRLIRMSWGWGRNYCRAGIKLFQNTSGIKSRTTIKSAIDRLIDRKIIYRYIDVNGQADRNQNGTIYIIPIPNPTKGSVPNTGIPKNDIPDKTRDSKALDVGIPKNGILKNGIPKNGIPKNELGGISENGIPKNGIPSANPDKSRDEQGIPKNGIPKNDAIKDISKDNLKDTLSPNTVITNFYREVGQKRVTKAKREKAQECIKKLLAESFSLEDIQFAAQWTLENSKDEIYDFSIIEHTMGQAMADKEKLESEKARKLEKEKMASEKREEERQNEAELLELKKHKGKLTKGKRANLRKKALDAIEKMEGVKKEFITEILIEAEENRILKSELKGDKQ